MELPVLKPRDTPPPCQNHTVTVSKRNFCKFDTRNGTCHSRKNVATGVYRTLNHSSWCYKVFFVLTILLRIMPSKAALCDLPMQDRYIQNIPEDLPVGTVIQHLNISGDEDQILVTQVQDNDHVTFDQTSRNVTLTSQLDYESQTSINLMLRCEIKETKQAITLNILILLKDVNDNPPVFRQSQYFASVNELTPINTTVVRDVEASDADPDNWYVTYQIIQGPYSDYFAIPIPAKGNIVLRKKLDYEEVQSIQLTVMAKDNHPPVNNISRPQLNSTTSVVITITDGDDLNPKFQAVHYSASLAENDVKGRQLDVNPKIRAVDDDVGINSSIVYSIVDDPMSDDDDYFVINPTTADITCDKAAPIRGTVLTLLIKATQSNNPDRFAFALLRVYVSATNENVPRFSQTDYNVEVVENIPVGSTVTKVNALDTDMDILYTWIPDNNAPNTPDKQGSLLTYSFVNAGTTFEIDQRTGEITTKKPLDYEADPEHILQVRATDGKYMTTCRVHIKLININDNPPKFQKKVYEFNTNIKPNALLGTVKATDPDPRTSITYSFKDESKMFTINNNGEIRATDDIPNEVLKEYKLFVVASDNGDPPLTDSTVAVVTVEGGVAAALSSSDDADFIIIIVLGILCGIFLVVVIILLVHIYRNQNRTQSPHNFVKSQSFESRLNLQDNLRNFVDNPEGLTYKPAQAHHLALYNNVALADEDGTRPQENPFQDSEDGATTSTGYTPPYDMNSNRKAVGDSMPDFSNDPKPSTTAAVVVKKNPMNQMNVVNEIEYETAVTPLGQGMVQHHHNHQHMGSEDMSDLSLQGSSAPSVTGSGSTLRGEGSTQQLMGPGTPGGTLRRKGGISFIDGAEFPDYPNRQGNSFPQVRPRPERPGITVYY